MNKNSPSISIVNLKIKQDSFDEFMKLITDHASNCISIEKDCLRFDVSVQKDSACSVWLYEMYKTSEAHKLHRETEHMQLFITKASDMIESKHIIESFLI